MGEITSELVGALQSGSELVRIVCELEPCAEDKPHWIHVLPFGPHVEARDGRRFVVQDVQAVAAASELPMLVDREHASEAGETEAYGWIEQLRVEPAAAGSRSGVWGRVDWTPLGRDLVRAKRFRFLSPVVIGKRSREAATLGQFHVERMTSVALTNRPALRMHGLEAFREQLSKNYGPFTTERDAMSDDSLRSIFCSVLGLPAGADDDTLIAAATPVFNTLAGKARSASFSAQQQPGTGRDPGPLHAPLYEPPPPLCPHGVDHAALKRMGFSEELIIESERELLQDPRPKTVDRKALKRMGLADAEIDASIKDLERAERRSARHQHA